MAKVYLLKESDFARLFAELERAEMLGITRKARDPQRVSNAVTSERDRHVWDEAFRRVNYVVRNWENEVKCDS